MLDLDEIHMRSAASCSAGERELQIAIMMEEKYKLCRAATREHLLGLLRMKQQLALKAVAIRDWCHPHLDDTIADVKLSILYLQRHVNTALLRNEKGSFSEPSKLARLKAALESLEKE